MHTAPRRMPKPYCGNACQLEKCTKGSGTGMSVTQNSGHAVCMPPESSDTSNTTLPVLLAKSKGCLGYIASDVTVPSPFG